MSTMSTASLKQNVDLGKSVTIYLRLIPKKKPKIFTVNYLLIHHEIPVNLVQCLEVWYCGQVKITPKDPSLAYIFGQKLSHFNSELAGEIFTSEQYLVASDERGLELGAAFAVKDWNWLNIELIYVEESMRRTGIGSTLLKEIEKWGIQNGCTKSFLDTFSFQAEIFYKKHGYEEFGRLENFPKGHSRIFLKKELIYSFQ